MKRFDKKTKAILFFAAVIGAILIGTGGAIAFFEYQSIDIITETEKEVPVTLSTEFYLSPTSNAKTVIQSVVPENNIQIEVDESLEKNQAEFDIMTYSLPNGNFTPELNFEQEKYLYNSETKHFSEYPVTLLNYSIVGYNSTENTDGDFENIKRVMKNLKDRKIYKTNIVFANEHDKIVIKVSPYDIDRISVVGDNYSVMSEEEKNEMMNTETEIGDF